MSILRVVANPADIGGGGYIWSTTPSRFDNTRVEGALSVVMGQSIIVPHAPRSTTWYHFRLNMAYGSNGAAFFEVRDPNSVVTAQLTVSGGPTIRAVAIGGGGTVNGPTIPISNNSNLSIDLQVIVGATVVVNLYLNGAFVSSTTAANASGTVRGQSASFILTSFGGYEPYFSEGLVADEDTRGMRVRELRPRSFGLFQEWDGTISNIRDTDLSTGLSVEDANRRVSFGVTNLENIETGDIINRVVAQSYAQRGEAGLTQFNHFFRHRDGTVTDGAAQALDVTGQYFIEDFLINPKTALPWTPEDFRSLQTGVRSLA